MTPLTALLVFAGIPIGLAVIIWVAVSAKAWGQGADASAPEADGPLLVTTGPALPDPSRLPRELDVQSRTLAGGGASGRW